MHYYLTLDHFSDWSLFEILKHLQISKQEAAKLSGKSERTLERWNKNTPPEVKNFFLACGGYLEAIDNSFTGWRLSKGKIWTPGNTGYRPTEIESIYYYQQMMAELRKLGNRRAQNWRYPVIQSV